MSKPPVALVSLGCPKNQVDAEVMLGLLEEAGYPLVEDPEEAEVLIVNTCAFIEPAVEEAVEALLELADLKRTGRLRALICAGCLTQRYGEALPAELAEVDYFLGPASVPQVVAAVAAALEGSRRVALLAPDFLYSADSPRWRSAPEWLAYVKIADGCDNRCTYCIVPSLRGRFRSRPAEDIAAEVGRLAQEQVQEVILIAQDLTCYGQDQQPPTSLPDLLRALARLDFPGWIRLMYLHPARVNAPLLEAMAACPGVIPYLDIPLQHAAPGVLRRMGRAGSDEEYLALVGLIRATLPRAAVRTTMMVGFPGETDADFDLLCDFVRAARFDRLSVFRYWPEAGTPAAEMPGQVPPEVGDERLDRLMRLQEDISLQQNRALVGRRLEVLVEEILPDRALARSYRDAPEVDGQVALLPATGLLRGRLVTAEVTGADSHDLMARLAER